MADTFAWVIPVQTVPEFSVGSELLFTGLLRDTVPGFQLFVPFGGCTAGGGGDSDGTTGTGDTGGPDILVEETVGAFDVVVLQGGGAQEVVDWLNANGYGQDPAVEPIVQDYVNEGMLFAAFRLTAGAGLDAVHPVVLRFPNTQDACVPLRLTGVAADDDMGVRTFFLGEHRVAPTNYRHIVPNWLKLDWSGGGTAWPEFIAAAVDEADVDGHAFVTEFAGGSDAVDPAGISSALWDSTPFETATVETVVDVLTAQGLMECPGMGNACNYAHPLVSNLLATYVPVPMGLDPDDFYACLSCYPAMIDAGAWDGPAFAADMQERIIQPADHAVSLLATWPYLTRLFTRISPAEMTEDPLFHQNPDLVDVDLRNLVVSGYEWPRPPSGCELSDGHIFTMPDGRQTYAEGTYLPTWPSFPGMPLAERVEVVPPTGPPMEQVNNANAIQTQVDDWNCLHGYPADGCDGGGTSTTDSGTTSGASQSSSTSGPGAEGGGAGSCACTARADPPLGWLAMLLLPGLPRRRRPLGHL